MLVLREDFPTDGGGSQLPIFLGFVRVLGSFVDPLQSPEMGNAGNTIFGTQKGTLGAPLLEPFK